MLPPASRAALLVALLVTSCGDEPHVERRSYTHIESGAGGAPGVTLEHEGAQVTFGDDVRFRKSLHTPARPEDGTFVNDLRLELAGGELRIGGESYGRVEPGQRAHVTAAGVTVDGEHRGALP